jgi:hypothetical protein
MPDMVLRDLRSLDQDLAGELRLDGFVNSSCCHIPGQTQHVGSQHTLYSRATAAHLLLS